MKITLNNIDPVNAELTIEVVKEDYAEEVKKGLKKIRDTSSIPGFRKGMTPPSLIQKMYGKSALVDEVNKLVSKSLYDYIKENNLNVLGEPLPSKKEQAPLDFDNQTDYEFTFDLGLAPVMNAKLAKSDKMPYYTIKVTEEMIEKQITNFKANYGSYDQVNEAEEKDMVKGLLVELNDDNIPKENGIQNENSVLMPSYIKEAEEKAKFVGAKTGDAIIFNPYKAYEGTEAELASFLKVKKEEVKNYTGNFSLQIEEITRYKEAELNQELFDKIYEPGTVTSEEQLKEKIKETIAQQMAPESDYKFILDAKLLLEKKAKDVQFPDAFLKRWLLASNPDRTEAATEEDYPKIIEDLRFHLIKEEIVKENNIQVESEDIRQAALKTTRAQFAQYGMSNIPDNLLENYAQEMLKKEETVRNLIDKVVEDKLITVLKEAATLKIKEVTVEEFQKLVENQK
jgi:trigger factor